MSGRPPLDEVIVDLIVTLKRRTRRGATAHPRGASARGHPLVPRARRIGPEMVGEMGPRRVSKEGRASKPSTSTAEASLRMAHRPSGRCPMPMRPGKRRPRQPSADGASVLRVAGARSGRKRTCFHSHPRCVPRERPELIQTVGAQIIFRPSAPHRVSLLQRARRSSASSGVRPQRPPSPRRGRHESGSP
jgi:hypothetical protein